jgi:hypothetical protein
MASTTVSSGGSTLTPATRAVRAAHAFNHYLKYRSVSAAITRGRRRRRVCIQ